MMWAAIWSSIRLFLHSVNWAALSYASYQVFWLSISVVASWTTIMLGLNAVERWSLRYGFNNSMPTWLSLSARSTRWKTVVNKVMPMVVMWALGYIIGQTQMFNPVREWHDVEVLQQTGARQFTVRIPAAPLNSAYKQDAVEHWKLCPPPSDDLPLKTGMVLPTFQYKQESGCMYIDKDTEVTYLRDGNNNVIDRQGHILYAKED